MTPMVQAVTVGIAIGLLIAVPPSKSTDNFCRECGAGIPPKPGEGTCPDCDPKGGE